MKILRYSLWFLGLFGLTTVRAARLTLLYLIVDIGEQAFDLLHLASDPDQYRYLPSSVLWQLIAWDSVLMALLGWTQISRHGRHLFREVISSIAALKRTPLGHLLHATQTLFACVVLLIGGGLILSVIVFATALETHLRQAANIYAVLAILALAAGGWRFLFRHMT